MGTKDDEANVPPAAAGDRPATSPSIGGARGALGRQRRATLTLATDRSAEDLHELLLELQAHQVEVEMQNSQLRSAQEALALSHERYSRLYEQAPVGYLTMNDEGVIVEANLTVAGLVDVDRRKLLGTPWTQYLAPEDQDTYYLLRRAAEGTRAAFSCEVRLKAQGVRARWVRMDAKPVAGPSPRESWWWATVTETTESRELSDELQHANKMRAVGVLASGVAHEFNNMLAVIVGHAELLGETLEGNATTGDDLGAIIAAARRARDVAAQLLAYGRKQVLSPVAVDLRAAASGLARGVRAHLHPATSLRMELADDVGAPFVDPAQLEQVLSNLAINARDAMADDGEVVIRIDNTEVPPGSDRGKDALPPGPYVRLRFSDNGSGIPADVAGRMFEPFFTTKPFGKGTGLGLAIVHGIVSQSGGSISVESALGRGSTFVMLLPQSTGAAARGVVPAAPRAAARRWTGRVLFVDDDPKVRAVVGRLIARLGFEVDEAPDGAQALARFTANPAGYRLVVTDVAMPGMDGVALARHLSELRPDVPLLFITGYLDAAPVEASPTKRALVLHKPFSVDDLAAAVAQLLAPAEGDPASS